jgi:hypothetical protein
LRKASSLLTSLVEARPNFSLLHLQCQSVRTYIQTGRDLRVEAGNLDYLPVNKLPSTASVNHLFWLAQIQI